MRSAKKNIRPASIKARTPLKPKPPADLWEQMDKVQAADHQPRFQGFTIYECAKRYGILPRTVTSKMRNMIERGTVEQGWRRTTKHWLRVYRFKK